MAQRGKICATLQTMCCSQQRFDCKMQFCFKLESFFFSPPLPSPPSSETCSGGCTVLEADDIYLSGRFSSSDKRLGAPVFLSSLSPSLFLPVSERKKSAPNQQRNFNKLLTELRCKNFVNKHRLSIQIVTKRAKTCMQCVHIPTELPFCTPPLVVGLAL